MGKFLSKHVSKRRQNPEGGSLSTNVLTCQKEMEQKINQTKLTQNLYVEVNNVKSDQNHNFDAVLPPKKTPNFLHSQFGEQMKKRNVATNDIEYTKVQRNGEEWIFTLYNFDTTGKVTKEDISILIHSMYEVLETFLMQPHSKITPLKIKLVVSSSPRTQKKEQRTSQEQEEPVTRLYCVGENIERRNHYLDLAGIENFSSKFDNTESSSHRVKGLSSGLQHLPVAKGENHKHKETPQQLIENKTLLSKRDKIRGEEKISKSQPVTSCCQPTTSYLQRSPSRRIHSSVKDSAYLKHPKFQTQPGRDSQISNLLHTCDITLTQKHNHHHHHEHHHHHYLHS